MTQTKYSVSEVNRITGKSRTTINKHIKSGKLSCERDSSGKVSIDAAELLRVYGEDCDFDRAVPASQSRQSVQTGTGQSLQSELNSVQARLDQEIKERERERRQLQEQIEHLQESLKLAQEGHNMLLLEHRSDIVPSEVTKWLAEERVASRMGIKTSNYYLAAFKQFCSWLETDGRGQRGGIQSSTLKP